MTRVRWLGLPVLYPMLEEMAMYVRPTSYLEIGVRDGASLATVVMAAGPQLHWITLCDTWDSAYGGSGRASHQHIEVLLDALRFQGEGVLYLDGDSKKLIPPLDLEGKRYDLITIDGDHSIEGASADLTNSWPLLTERGVLVMDDLNSHLGPLFEEFSKHVGAKILRYEKVGVGAGALSR